MEKLMSISRKVDKVLKFFNRFLIVGFSIIFVFVAVALIGVAIGKMPEVEKALLEITEVSIGEVEFILKEPMAIEKSVFLKEMSIALLGAGVLVAVACYITHILRNILKPMIAGTPFDGTASKEIKKLGIILIVSELLASLESVIYNAANSFWTLDIHSLLPEEVSRINVTYNVLDGSIILTGVLVILLSYVFRYGEMLQQQADETL